MKTPPGKPLQFLHSKPSVHPSPSKHTACRPPSQHMGHSAWTLGTREHAKTLHEHTGPHTAWSLPGPRPSYLGNGAAWGLQTEATIPGEGRRGLVMVCLDWPVTARTCGLALGAPTTLLLFTPAPGCLLFCCCCSFLTRWKPALWGLIALSQLLPNTGTCRAAETASAGGGGRAAVGRGGHLGGRGRREPQAQMERGPSLGDTEGTFQVDAKLGGPRLAPVPCCAVTPAPKDREPAGQRETLQGDHHPGQC